nr:MAG TPA: hypothetical protein [Caudoviricetes sp.]
MIHFLCIYRLNIKNFSKKSLPFVFAVAHI